MAQLLPGYAIGDENEQEEFAHYPAAVGFAEATAACKRLGCRLPTEVEWEYLCRAGTETLFLWGDSLPWDETGEDAPWLDGWLRQECADQAALTANGFGLQCLMGAEWCQDPYTEGHAAEAPTRPGFRVAKAGGGASYPGWQVYEWLWCLPTWRHAIPESFTSEAIRQLLEIDHHTPAARPVFEVMLDT